MHGPPAAVEALNQRLWQSQGSDAEQLQQYRDMLPRAALELALGVTLPAMVHQHGHGGPLEGAAEGGEVDAGSSGGSTDANAGRHANKYEACGICYSFVLASASASSTMSSADTSSSAAVLGSVPTESCSNPRCGKRYHRTCLLNWLSSLPTARSSFGLLFGQCPFCSDSINVRTG